MEGDWMNRMSVTFKVGQSVEPAGNTERLLITYYFLLLAVRYHQCLTELYRKPVGAVL